MESDKDIREAGAKAQEVLSSKEAKAIIGVLSGINPSLAMATQVLNGLASLIASSMRKNKDDELLLMSGTLLRDVMGEAPYNIREIFNENNDHADLEVEVFPIPSSSKRKKSSISVEIATNK